MIELFAVTEDTHPLGLRKSDPRKRLANAMGDPLRVRRLQLTDPLVTPAAVGCQPKPLAIAFRRNDASPAFRCELFNTQAPYPGRSHELN